MEYELQHSQNFIRNSKLIKSLLRKSDITARDTVVDIGAGEGVITRELAKVAKKVIALEIDPQSVINMQNDLADIGNVEILEQNLFTYALPSFPYKVFSNPPFDRISDIVRYFLDAANPPKSLYLFIQKEAAQRFIGVPKMTQIASIYYPQFEVKIVSNVYRTEFVPVPNIDIVFAQFIKRKRPLIEKKDLNQYRDFITYLFNQWQPTVIDSLKQIFTREQRRRIDNNLKLEKTKPSELEGKQLISLFKTFKTYTSAETQEVVRNSYRRLQAEQRYIEKTHRTSI